MFSSAVLGVIALCLVCTSSSCPSYTITSNVNLSVLNSIALSSRCENPSKPDKVHSNISDPYGSVNSGVRPDYPRMCRRAVRAGARAPAIRPTAPVGCDRVTRITTNRQILPLLFGKSMDVSKDRVFLCPMSLDVAT